MTENLTLLKLLADETRLRIINILAEGDSYVELIATKLELTPATVCYHLKKMEAAGMVNSSRAQFYIIYSLNGDIFDRPLRDLLITGDKTVDKEEERHCHLKVIVLKVLLQFRFPQKNQALLTK